MTANQVALLYLVASVLFILSLKGLSHPLSARRGNLFGMVGMAIAAFTTVAVNGWVVAVTLPLSEFKARSAAMQVRFLPVRLAS